ELPDTGIVTTFCIVNVPFLGQKIQPPYVSAYVLLDGADIAFLHLVLGCDASEVRMGMRVKAVWKPEEERTYSLENISHFEPTGEADADFETYRRHL
ncbi:MAG TPA: OB-fold domain-containing protein, partial [Marmoricola sp.]|nr:OB-fold domain-containing protein [Marmoricola sp.]